MIEGRDPQLKNEYVVYCAHYDHMGVRGGEIYNWASDNASGSVAILAIAKAMADQKPRRSIIFAWFTGEEKGMWGSQKFVNSPPVPIGKISACIDLDVLIGKYLETVTTSGGRKLSFELDAIMQSVNEKNMHLTFDRKFDFASSGLFFSSDHFTFMKYGVPSIWLSSEGESDPTIHRSNDKPDKTDCEKMA